MALKDWKKFERINELWFANKIKQLILVIDKKEYGYGLKYGVELYDANMSRLKLNNLNTKWFKTKSNALKFAKAYMRKH